MRAAELQTQLNRMTADQHLEYLRSTQLIEASVQVTHSLSHFSKLSICNAGSKVEDFFSGILSTKYPYCLNSCTSTCT